MLDSGEGALSVTAHSARNIKNVELAGKQDPYMLLSLDFNDPKSYKKTCVDYDGGRDPNWNQNFKLPYNGQDNLYIELMDQEKGVDEVIGFAAIPLSQVFNAHGRSLYGTFGIFAANGIEAGEVNLSIAAPGASIREEGEPTRGESFVCEKHLQRMKKMRTKAIAGDVGTAILGGALAAGAGFLGKKLYDEYQKRQEGENAPEWKPEADYEAGQDVEYNGTTYVCIQNHTAQDAWAPADTPSIWKVVQ